MEVEIKKIEKEEEKPIVLEKPIEHPEAEIAVAPVPVPEVKEVSPEVKAPVAAPVVEEAKVVVKEEPAVKAQEIISPIAESPQVNAEVKNLAAVVVESNVPKTDEAKPVPLAEPSKSVPEEVKQVPPVEPAKEKSVLQEAKPVQPIEPAKEKSVPQEAKPVPPVEPEKEKSVPQEAKPVLPAEPAKEKSVPEEVKAIPTPPEVRPPTPAVAEPKKEEPEGEPSPNIQDDDGDNVIQEEQEEDKKEVDAPKMRFALLEKLLSLLNCPEINPVLAGYFAKAMQVLLEKRKLEIMQYIFLYREHMLNILKHSYNKSIAEILSKILSNEDKYLTGITGEEFTKEKQDILKLMIEKMSSINSIEDITNNCFILCTLVDTKQQMSFFMSDEILKRVFSIATSQHPMSLRAGLTYFITLNRLKNASPPSQSPSGQFNFLGMSAPPPSIF